MYFIQIRNSIYLIFDIRLIGSQLCSYRKIDNKTKLHVFRPCALTR